MFPEMWRVKLLVQPECHGPSPPPPPPPPLDFFSPSGMCVCVPACFVYALVISFRHNYFDCTHQCCARMETSDLPMEVLRLKVVWRYAGMRLGALYVMEHGQETMHKWPADSWDTLQMVRMRSIAVLENTPSKLSTPYT